MTQIQLLNDELVELLSAKFQRRYEPNFAWGNAASILTQLPGLREYWPCGPSEVIGGDPYVKGISCNYGLEIFNNMQFSYSGLAQFVTPNGVNQFAGRTADTESFDILGNEVYNAFPGLTIGIWVYATRAPWAVAECILAKWEAVPNAQYQLQRRAAGQIALDVYGVGTVSIVDTVTCPLNAWTFFCGRYSAGAELALFRNRNKTTNVVGIPAAMNNGNAYITLAARSSPATPGGAEYFQGKLSNAFICASAISDTMIYTIYEQTRALYGV